jgi:dipeptidyl aminopeptidase/acylaminoacyl peptidase
MTQIYRVLVFCGLLLFIFPPAKAQTIAKKPLSHDVYDSWKAVAGDSLSNDGRYLIYTINPQEGDGVLELVALPERKTSRYPRGARASFTSDSRHLAFLVKPPVSQVRAAKLKKKKPEEMPQDSLALVNLQTGSRQLVARVKSFRVPKNGGSWVAYLKSPEPAAKPAADDKKKSPAPAKPATAKKAEVGDLVIQDLASNQSFQFKNVSSFIFADKGNAVYFIRESPDTTRRTAVYAFDLKQKAAKVLSRGAFAYKSLVTDPEGDQLAFLSTADSTDKEVRNFRLLHWKAGQKQASVVADTSFKGLPAHWMVSENGQLQFSKDGKRLFFGTFPQPRPYEKDTTKLDEDKVSLDIWTWKDPLIQPMQLRNLERERKRSFTALYDLSHKRLVQLANLEIPDVYLDPDKTGEVAVGISDVNYLLSVGYEMPSKKDAWLISLKDGSRQLVLRETRGAPRLSPAGKYLYWYEPGDSTWYAQGVRSRHKVNLAGKLPVKFYDELNDIPSFPEAYGAVGWLPQDAGILLYDRFDIWQADPAGKAAPRNVTGGYGRQHNLQLRYVHLDPERGGRALSPEEPFLLSGMRLDTKAAGFYRGDLRKPGAPQQLIFGDFALAGLKKARDGNTLVYRRSTFQEYGDIWATDLSFRQPQRLTTANPQQNEYLWGSVELVHWQSADNIPLEGMLYKPENFDPKKKYPMIVYFYERSADGLHRYLPPAPSASTINRALAVSNGYLVFVPDIVYKTGYPGESAMNCIMPGVMRLLEQGFVDEKNIALQGQSWGGYQIAYMVTRTNLFKAAMAGAPVSNMTSAYGGIRWETGISRQFQYEKTQSRIGGTLWEKPLLYIENSPLFFADKVQTPVLIMANDNDGAVPWYQGIEYFMALRRLQKPVWMLVYNGEAHNLVQRKNRKDLSVRMLQFFDYYLKGAPMPAWMKKGVPSIYKGKDYGLELVEEKTESPQTESPQ